MFTPCSEDHTQCDDINDRCVCKPGYCMTESGECELNTATVTTKFASGFVPGAQPEFAKPELVDRTENVGISFSGGGNRAFSFGFGIARMLRDQALLERIRISSALSGGNWLQTILAYAPSSIGDDTLLAPAYAPPAEIDDDHLASVPEGSALRATTTDFFAQMLQGINDGRMQDAWKFANRKNNLEPYGLGAQWAQLGYDVEYAAAAQAANPGVLDGATFHTVRGNRPYPVTVVNLMGPEALLDQQFLVPSQLEYTYMEVTPMYSCVEGGASGMTERYRVYPGGEYNGTEVEFAAVPVGGCVESFAWGADAPPSGAMPAVDAAAAPWHGSMEVPLPAEPLALDFVVAASFNIRLNVAPSCPLAQLG